MDNIISESERILRKIKQGSKIKSILGELISLAQAIKKASLRGDLHTPLEINPPFCPFAQLAHLPGGLRWPHQAESRSQKR